MVVKHGFIPQFRLSIQLSYVKYVRYGRNKIFPSTFLLITSDGRISSGNAVKT